MKKKLKIYSACGNKIGVLPVKSLGTSDLFKFKIDSSLKKELAELGSKNKCDSIMLLNNDYRRNPSTVIFEPNAGTNENPGGFSTMCGNGIRAVSEYLFKNTRLKPPYLVKTLSGDLGINKKNGQWQVNMGKLYVEKYMQKYLSGIINHFEFKDKIIGKLTGFGITCNPKATVIDGEPHMVVEANNGRNSLSALRYKALKLGPEFTKNNKLFPLEINLNLYSITKITNTGININLVTFERNLGNDPEKSITKACGSGATVTAGLIMDNFFDKIRVNVNCLGGRLSVFKDGNNYLFLSGPVKNIRIG